MRKKHLLTGILFALLALLTATTTMAQSQITMKTTKTRGETINLRNSK
ncbi:hypothetical protein [Porphyromonas circumdentaria]|uniref:Uncharacterized protein n=1 Tax=Porphyromonas circumdentaria TaxID=29524 RepID=A0A1T4LNB1_9PORP|nr:hypothetical protein [Porphyromonas circumdentaria]MBB6275515.1 hypothetical protein [Porphyromonas circumdentaria]SJZ56141.1 hypothetical protein SAMN02745171_00456 [Porphyromonas circumdentaria]